MTLQHWLSRLERLHFKSIDMGLDRVQRAAQQLGVLENTGFVFTVAGTNGKGSTTHLIQNAVLASGYSVGLYTSPHIVRFNERIRINGQECADEQIVTALEAVEVARGDISLTYFEFTTLAAAWLFQQHRLDAWVLEVGLGGRLDAVNVWDADVAVVTSIDLDHQQWLGKDRTAIGREKIGIGRKGKPLVMGEPNPPEQVIQSATEQGFIPLLRGRDFDLTSDESSFAGQWQARISTQQGCKSLTGLPIPEIYLNNALSALQALMLSPFNPDPETLKKVLAEIRVAGRQQMVSHQPRVMLDVGHNPHAARALKTVIQAQRASLVHCIVGMMSDKAVQDTLLELLPEVDIWYPVQTASDRALSAPELRDLLLEMGARVGECVRHAGVSCQWLMGSVDKNDLILVFGSFYTVSDVIQYNDFQ